MDQSCPHMLEMWAQYMAVMQSGTYRGNLLVPGLTC